jgi:hypothetical protein
MAIIEKPSGAVQIFASSEEARELGTSVIDVPITDFVDSLDQPEVQEVLTMAQARCDDNPVE